MYSISKVLLVKKNNNNCIELEKTAKAVFLYEYAFLLFYLPTF